MVARKYAAKERAEGNPISPSLPSVPAGRRCRACRRSCSGGCRQLDGRPAVNVRNAFSVTGKLHCSPADSKHRAVGGGSRLAGLRGFFFIIFFCSFNAPLHASWNSGVRLFVPRVCGLYGVYRRNPGRTGISDRTLFQAVYSLPLLKGGGKRRLKRCNKVARIRRVGVRSWWSEQTKVEQEEGYGRHRHPPIARSDYEVSYLDKSGVCARSVCVCFWYFLCVSPEFWV